MITMGKRLSFPTRSFGSDTVPPDPSLLPAWVAERRGREGDLTSFLLEQGIFPQIDAGVTSPCAGGTFYTARWREAIEGVEDGIITDELGVRMADVIRDAEDMTRIRKGLFMTVPAPHMLGLHDRYYQDPEEAGEALFSVYRALMRGQRDAGLHAHVIICDTVLRAELEALTRQKVFFFPSALNRKSLSLLLEYQQIVALTPSLLPLLSDLMGEYDVHRIVLLDPEEQDLRQALQIRDPDQILCGGFCRESCGEYWKNLVKKAKILK
ncbi:MAG: hypothetical protein GKC06_06850 [Methanomicrobiales archaeon]|nr:hypothetical protein [Methanomicrobiales archaeon]